VGESQESNEGKARLPNINLVKGETNKNLGVNRRWKMTRLPVEVASIKGGPRNTGLAIREGDLRPGTANVYLG